MRFFIIAEDEQGGLIQLGKIYNSAEKARQDIIELFSLDSWRKNYKYRIIELTNEFYIMKPVIKSELVLEKE